MEECWPWGGVCDCAGAWMSGIRRDRVCEIVSVELSCINYVIPLTDVSSRPGSP